MPRCSPPHSSARPPATARVWPQRRSGSAGSAQLAWPGTHTFHLTTVQCIEQQAHLNRLVCRAQTPGQQEAALSGSQAGQQEVVLSRQDNRLNKRMAESTQYAVLIQCSILLSLNTFCLCNAYLVCLILLCCLYKVFILFDCNKDDWQQEASSGRQVTSFNHPITVSMRTSISPRKYFVKILPKKCLKIILKCL